ncbi:sigma-54-dependent Fis family transcriptional regulator [Alkaliphilus peptidifermentans]|uniref:Transcriptional regulator containing PAS, AAA-type ATPase, and DNA-binding Fis domains n=1 Tax=Alkaliphilus peptidifermentans DSM 18978 TaxID=1120976 RepID=A0A1G5G1H9_9FIRM|nr:sigma 54-interacting transcriptional regulator [Alkaliphilus peptidifermentans]SCY45167.1 Transcriptional regulator containing PAS, AAA-type ATPase, and DNA-binding Fis domains [Alkaliphilus peptidifermentans DSM 18978]
MGLMRIASNVQNISEAIASVIKVDVTVVDSQYIRVAGTGSYREGIGERVNENSVFGVAIKKGESFIIENAGQHAVCLQCSDANNCKEYAEVCCPIKINNEVIGVIGLIAFEEKQRDEILYNQNNLIVFLNKMADLISSKLLEQNSTDKLEILAKEMEIVLNSVNKGILAVDEEGRILRYNQSALKLFQVKEEEIMKTNIKDFIGLATFESLINQEYKVKNKEFAYKKGKYHLRGVFDTNPISINNESFGIVFIFSKLSDVLSTVNDISTGTISTDFDEIIGESVIFKEVKLEAKKASQSTSTILIQGESGTGKELFARAIHFNSDRAKAPFIPINCAAIPEQLLESELFGYEEGAFTGAKRGGKAGKFLLATRGTIFLDEIGEMPLHLQTKLLRVLQEQMIEKIGGKELIPIDVRVIAASNKELEKKVLEGEFRQDLFYRINVIPLQIPSLRQRKEDISTLVDYLLKKCNSKLRKNIREIDSMSLEIFMKYNWPGNVRELENTIEYAVNMCNGSVITKADLPKRLINRDMPSNITNECSITSIKELEKREIQKAVSYFSSKKHNIADAAEALGLSRATLYRKIKEYNIKTVSE